MSGPGHNPLVHEDTVANSEPYNGYRTQIDGLLGGDLMLWRTSGLITLTGSTTPKLASYSGASAAPVVVIQWVFGNAVANYVQKQFVMPDEFADLQRDWIVTLYARKFDTDDAENADLALQVKVVWHVPGQAMTASDNVTATTSAVGAATSTSPFATLVADIGAALRAASKTIPRGAIVNVQVGPNEQVGSTDLLLEVGGVIDTVRRHAALKDRTKRGE